MVAKCDACMAEIECPGHGGFGKLPFDKPVLPCAEQCEIWIRAVDDRGKPVAGVTASAAGKSGVTIVSGFAKLEDLPEGENTVDLALDDKADPLYRRPEPAARKEMLKKGDLKLITVTVIPRVAPVLAPSTAV